MFYELTEIDVQKIRTKYYPQELAPNEFLKSVVINTYGSDNPDNSVKVSLSVKDGIFNDPETKEKIFKVFNNQQALKYMRLKLFEISSDKMKTLVSSAKNIYELETVINKYGALSVNLTPSLDFIGNKTIVEEHIPLEDFNNCIELVYEQTLLLPRSKINFLSLGLVFYFDKQNFISDQKIDESFIDDRALWDKVYIYDIVKNNALIPNSKLPIQDLRLVKSTFKETSFLDNLLQIINSDVAYNKIVNIQQHLDSNIFSEETTDLNAAATALLGLSVKPKKQKFFSNAYFSRNSNNYLGFTFSIDYEGLIKQNTVYKNLLERSALKQEFIDKCNITSLNILRRETRNKGSGNYLPLPDTKTTIISSADLKRENLLREAETDNGTLEEILIETGKTAIHRSFSVTDKKIFNDKYGFYQYGFELVISNAINDFLTKQAVQLSFSIRDLKDYLAETDKIVRTVLNDKTGYSLQGSYDPQRNSFTSKFIADFNERRGKDKTIPSLRSVVARAVSVFTSTLDLLGLLTTKRDDLQSSIISILDPQSTSAESIIYFINIYEKLLSQLNKIIKNNINNSFTIEYWFKDVVDVTTPINIGYKFFDVDDYKGLGILVQDSFYKRVNLEINRFSSNNNLDFAQYGNKQFSYLTPNSVFSKNKILDYTVLDINSNSIQNIDFAELEIDIKDAALFGFGGETTIIKQKANNSNLARIANVAAKASGLSGKLPLTVNNTLVPVSDLAAIKQKQQEKNNAINETNLMLALTRQFDLVNKKYTTIIKSGNDNLTLKEILKNSPVINNTGAAKRLLAIEKDAKETPSTKIDKKQKEIPKSIQKELTNPDYPIHINLLINDKCSLLRADENYKKSLELNSKFDFLFNTIHSIEVLQYTNEMFEESWTLLTKEILDVMNPRSLYLCRLKSYKNISIGIKGMEQINLPIYEQHFFLTGTKENIQFEFTASKRLRDAMKEQEDAINKKLNDKFNDLIDRAIVIQSVVTPTVIASLPLIPPPIPQIVQANLPPTAKEVIDTNLDLTNAPKSNLPISPLVAAALNKPPEIIQANVSPEVTQIASAAASPILEIKTINTNIASSTVGGSLAAMAGLFTSPTPTVTQSVPLMPATQGSIDKLSTTNIQQVSAVPTTPIISSTAITDTNKVLGVVAPSTVTAEPLPPPKIAPVKTVSPFSPTRTNISSTNKF